MRVVVTGMGAISALGPDVAGFWSGLRAGRPAIGPLPDELLSRLRFGMGAQVLGYDPAACFEPREIALMDRFAQFAVLAVREAVAQAGVSWTSELRERTAVVTGSCLGGRYIEESGYQELYGRNGNRIHPLTIPLSMPNAGASHISMQFGLQGPAYTVSTACASSAHAIGQAFWAVRSGSAPLAIAGGSEAPFFLGGLKAWEAMRVVSKDTCRPFSRERSGLILGEGAAMLVLEPLAAAVARGAEPVAEIAGFGMSADAGHITNPEASGPARAMRAAMADAELAPEQVGYINAHGTATEANDRIETAAIREVFGAHADRLLVSSTKSMHGHTLGAAGALEAVASAMALRDGFVPPTANYLSVDPACDLDVVPNAGRAVAVDACLSNSFAFGGLNAVLAFRRFA